MKTTMMTKSPNFPTILQMTKFVTFSITSTQEKAYQLLLIISLYILSISNNQFYTKALLDLNTQSSINHQLPSVGNLHQFSQLLEILPVMVSV
jgi:hypothetical protein